MFANIKIGIRLAAGFATVLLLMAVLAFVGISGMSNVQGRLDEIVNDNMVKLGLVNDMAEAVHVVTRVTRTIVLLEDQEARSAERKKLDSFRQKYNEAWTSLEKFPASEKGKAIRAKIKELATDARAQTDKVIDLDIAGNEKDAIKHLMSVAAPAAQKWQDALDENAALQQENTKNDYQAAQQAYASAHTMVLTLAGVAIALGALIAWFRQSA